MVIVAGNCSNIIVEGSGVVPDVLVPINEETVFGGGDPVLSLSVELLSQ